MRVRVDSRMNQLLWDTLSVVERVPGLEPLGPGPHHELVGAPNNHSGTNDPCRAAPSLTSLHYRNHYGTPGVIQAIRNIAASYDSLDPGIRLRINDMSLVFGGLFDTGNRWTTGLGEAHAEHRLGQNADIGFTGVGATNQCDRLKTARLLRAIEVHTLGRVKVHDDHYHVRMR